MRSYVGANPEQPRIWLWVTAFIAVVAGVTLVAEVLEVDQLDEPSYGIAGYTGVAEPTGIGFGSARPAQFTPTEAVAGDSDERTREEAMRAGAGFKPVARTALAGHEVALSSVRVTRVVGSHSFFVRPPQAADASGDILVVLSGLEGAGPAGPIRQNMHLSVQGTLQDFDAVSARSLGLASTRSDRAWDYPSASGPDLYIEATQVAVMPKTSLELSP